MKMEKHVTLIAVLNIGFGIIGALFGCFVFVAVTGGGALSRDPEVIAMTSFIGTVVGLFFITLSVPEIVGGVGLLKLKSWARILVLIIAVLDLAKIPFGTAIGVYTLWVLLNDKTTELFTQGTKLIDNPI